jgi:hypothetical protein
MRKMIWGTYEWKTAICACVNLRLVQVDKYPGMSKRSASSVACDHAFLSPANGLFVDELNGGVRARLLRIVSNHGLSL